MTARTDRPHIVCHMTSSIDGRLHPSRYTDGAEGAAKDWTAAYERLHDAFDANGWIVGRVTMAEMAKGKPHPPADPGTVTRPLYIANRDASTFAIAPDNSARLHFTGGDIGGDHVIVLLGAEVADAHLAELAADGVSYIVSDGAEVDLPAALATLRREFGIERLLLEGGGGINGSFLAAGLVDEFSVVIAPALDGGLGVDGIVAFDGGLKGRVKLALTDCERLDGGVVHLRYRVDAG